MTGAEPRPGRPLRPLLVAGVLALVVGLLALAGLKSYRELGTVRAREAQLEAEIRAVEQEAERLTERIRALQTDPVVLEREVRRSLLWVGPGEVVVHLPEPDSEPEPVADVEAVAAPGT